MHALLAGLLLASSAGQTSPGFSAQTAGLEVKARWKLAVQKVPFARDDDARERALAAVDELIDQLTPAQLAAAGALHDVVFFNLDAQASRLLKRGVAVDARDKDGRAALHVAALASRPRMVELLVQHKADIGAADKRGLTPLLLAVHAACAREVVESGLIGMGGRGDFGLKPRPKRKPIDFSKGSPVPGADETLRLLLKLGANPQQAAPGGITPLHLAAMIEDQQRVILFLGLDQYRAGGNRVIGNASYWDNYLGYDGLSVVEVLLEAGAKQEDKGYRGLTPVDVAATPAIRARLLKAGGKSGLTGLAAAVAAGDLRQVRKLLAKSKDGLNEPSLGGLTPLTWALLHRDGEMAALLLANGADAAKRDSRGLSPFWLALSADRMDLVALLLARGASAETPLTKEEVPLAAVRLWWYSPPEGFRPLALAMRGRVNQATGEWSHSADPRLLKLLLAFDADPNGALDDTGWTALHYAAACDLPEVARLLLDHGADKAAKDREGKTPLECVRDEAGQEIRGLLK
jgi:ankyrin repeat protein